MFLHSQKVVIEMGPLTLAAVVRLVATLANNLPVNSNDASDAALIDAQTARIAAVTGTPNTGGPVSPSVAGVAAVSDFPSHSVVAGASVPSTGFITPPAIPVQPSTKFSE